MARDWKRAHPNADRDYRKRWRLRYPAKAKAKAQRDYAKRRETGYGRRYYSLNKDRYKDWTRQYKRTHPGIYRAAEARRRARMAGSPAGPIDYDAIFVRDNGYCGICGGPVDLEWVHFDHIIPLSSGGSHSPDNLQTAHPWCNVRKGHRTSLLPRSA